MKVTLASGCMVAIGFALELLTGANTGITGSVIWCGVGFASAIAAVALD